MPIFNLLSSISWVQRIFSKAPTFWAERIGKYCWCWCSLLMKCCAVPIFTLLRSISWVQIIFSKAPTFWAERIGKKIPLRNTELWQWYRFSLAFHNNLRPRMKNAFQVKKVFPILSAQNVGALEKILCTQDIDLSRVKIGTNSFYRPWKFFHSL